MRQVADAGFETGIHCFDHTLWQDFVSIRDRDWTARQMELAVARFHEIFGHAPHVHGAAGWQMNDHAFELEEQMSFDYASDTRGSGPFVPFVAGRAIACPQLPTTLPTLDELLGLGGVTENNVHTEMLALTRVPGRHGHVFTLHAEIEGLKLRPVLGRLLAGWRDQGYSLVALRTLRLGLDIPRLPVSRVVAGAVPGRSGQLACQDPVNMNAAA
jgi:peptidoglycan/xylan/chitin deacetylase (PgdA/CDA1 family)